MKMMVKRETQGTSEGRLRVEHSSLSPVLVRRQLEKILSSTRFRRCERMGRLLRVLVEYTLDHDDGPNAHYIAAQVFEKQDFDPRIDPIVRVEARRLRKILYDYYQGEGAHDHLVVSLPRGGYRASFTRRPADGPVRNCPAKSIAVLPFLNMTSDGGREAFCDGVTEELINALTRMDDLKVAARTSAFQYKEPHDVRDIGKDLGVAAVIEGSVRVAEERIRVTAQLSSASDGFHLWSQTFDAPFQETFKLQEELATEIAIIAGKKLQSLR